MRSPQTPCSLAWRKALTCALPCVSTRTLTTRNVPTPRSTCTTLRGTCIARDLLGRRRDFTTSSEVLPKLCSSTPTENVEFLIDLKRKFKDVESNLLDACETPEGLTAIMDARSACNDMIVKLPRPELMKLDKTLYTVLRRAVTFDTTVITRVSKDCAPGILSIVSNSDRVHPIRTDRDLTCRLANNRSVFILTHRLLPSRPLVVLHVAHSAGMFQCVSDIKEGMDKSSVDSLCRREQENIKSARSDHVGVDVIQDTGGILSSVHFPASHPFTNVNTFYSISSLEIALRGIPCGGWCISKAKSLLAAPHTLYTTLSPIPGLRNWINVSLKRQHPRVVQIIASGSDFPEVELLLSRPASTPIPRHLRPTVARLAAYYLVKEKQRGRVLCPVGHFHVTNGAVLWGLRWGGTRSEEMQAQSLGLMVNYLYDSDAPARATQYDSDDMVMHVGRAVEDLLD